ncbi:MAG: hypothetical protein ABEK84_05475 [Salinibacter sp.]
MTDASQSGEQSPRRNWRKWIVGGSFLVFFAAVMWTVINPYRGQRFEKIPHGSHVHYVPKDRNPDVPVGRFPTRKPAKDERITPDGKVVPIRDSVKAR